MLNMPGIEHHGIRSFDNVRKYVKLCKCWLHCRWFCFRPFRTWLPFWIGFRFIENDVRIVLKWGAPKYGFWMGFFTDERIFTFQDSQWQTQRVIVAAPETCSRAPSASAVSSHCPPTWRCTRSEISLTSRYVIQNPHPWGISNTKLFFFCLLP